MCARPQRINRQTLAPGQFWSFVTPARRGVVRYSDGSRAPFTLAWVERRTELAHARSQGRHMVFPVARGGDVAGSGMLASGNQTHSATGARQPSVVAGPRTRGCSPGTSGSTAIAGSWCSGSYYLRVGERALDLLREDNPRTATPAVCRVRSAMVAEVQQRLAREFGTRPW